MSLARFFVLLALSLAAAACQQQPAPNTLSLEEAKRTAAQMTEPGLALPPRSVQDVLAMLDAQKSDAGALAQRRAGADAAPPPGLAGAALADFYVKRGQNARYLMRTDQAIADLSKAVELAPDNLRALQRLAAVQRLAGYPRSALDNYLRALEIQPGNPSVPVRPEILQPPRGGPEQRTPGGPAGRPPGPRPDQRTPVGLAGTMNVTGEIAIVQISLGEFDRAADYTARMEALYARLPNNPLWKNAWAALRYRNIAISNLTLGKFNEARDAALAGRVAAEAAVRGWTPEQEETNEVDNFKTMQLVFERVLADTATFTGRLPAGEAELRAVLQRAITEFGQDATVVYQALYDLALNVRAQGRFAEAARLAQRAIDMLQRTDPRGRSTDLAKARLLLASCLYYQGDARAALALYETAARELPDDPGFIRRNTANADYISTLLDNGRYDDALKASAAMQAGAERLFGQGSPNGALARGLGAVAFARKGDTERALAEFTAVVPSLRSIGLRAEQEGRKTELRAVILILDSYLDLLVRIRGTPLEARVPGGSAAAAFLIAEQARGQNAQAALTGALARAQLPDPGLAELARQAQDARLATGNLERVLLGVQSLPPDQTDPAALARLRDQITQLRAAEETLRNEIFRRYPAYRQLVDPVAPNIEQARASLRDGEALISFHIGPRQALVWAVPKSGAVAFAAVPLSSTELQSRVSRLRHAVDAEIATLGDVPPFDVGLAQDLYAALLKPVESGWKGAKSLVLVPDGALAALPLGLLVTAPTQRPVAREGQALFAEYRSVPWLAREAAIDQLPSTAALVSLRTAHAPSANRRPFVGFGDPLFSRQQAAAVPAGDARSPALRGAPLRLRSAPATDRLSSAGLADLPRLPDTADEVREIAAALHADPQQDVFVGPAASEAKVRSDIVGNRRVVVFATHGLKPGDLDGLDEPALALSAPGVADGGGTGLLTIDKIVGLKLDADWVVLSACNTAGEGSAAAEAVSGLGRAFFYAGTRALLVSNWAVETTSARAITTDLFRRQAADASLSRAEALRRAELALIDGEGRIDEVSGKAVFSYAHPIFWAPFSLLGDGG